ncbi:transcriptional regulator [Streptomyces sp. NPDC059740]|uniref:helix-turn-helix domain-containing protein n=1 Tax=Streptomyces sp. NPDC059740 TaxID=3346926 RepID=UPI00364E3820
MYDTAARRNALRLVRDGHSLNSASKETGISRSTLRSWLVASDPGIRRNPRATCPRHPVDGHLRQVTGDYSYLLGLYLGDGYIVHHRAHRVPKLSVACGDAWPGLVELAANALAAVFPANRVGRVRGTGCSYLYVTSKHLPCLFPQHGPGKKHSRPIVLADWQQEIVAEHPWSFLRGLFHSDGCRITNWTTRLIGGEPKRYEYPRYFFTNKSADINALCTGTLDAVGVEWRLSHRRQGRPSVVSVARRASVALMDAHIGPKY